MRALRVYIICTWYVRANEGTERGYIMVMMRVDFASKRPFVYILSINGCIACMPSLPPLCVCMDISLCACMDAHLVVCSVWCVVCSVWCVCVVCGVWCAVHLSEEQVDGDPGELAFIVASQDADVGGFLGSTVCEYIMTSMRSRRGYDWKS